MPVEDGVVLGANVRIAHPDLVNLYACTVGEATLIGPFVEIQRGMRRCSVQNVVAFIHM